MAPQRSRVAVASAVVILSAASCTQVDRPDAGGQDGAAREATSGAVAVDEQRDDGGRLELPIAGSHGEAWDEALTIPYGSGEATLGASRGGADGPPRTGAGFGAEAPDGSWWFLDPAGDRVVRFDATGEYLDQVELGPEQLVQERFFPYQRPRVLADGTLVAVAYTGDRTRLLRVRDGEADVVRFSERVLTIVADDGRSLYGLDASARLSAIDVEEASRTPVDWLATRTGDRFRLGVVDDELRLELPDQDPPLRRRWSLTAADTDEPVRPSLQLATDELGRIHLLLVGQADADPETHLSAYVRLSASGDLELVEPTPDLSGGAHSGDRAHLGVRVGGTTPWLMTVAGEEVRVLRRTS